MHNFNIGPSNDSQDLANLQIIESSMNNNSYSYWISAKELEDDSSAAAATFVTGTDTVPAHWVLANAVTSGVGFYIRRHSDWKYGSFDLKPHWSSSSKAGDVLFVRKCDRFSTIPAAVTAGTIRNQAASYDINAGRIKVTLLQGPGFRQDSLMDQSKIGMYVHLRRDGGNGLDTNAGDVSIYGIELIYNEVKRVIGEVVKK